MRSKDVFHRLFFAPVIAVAFRTEATVAVDVFHALEIICWRIVQSRCYNFFLFSKSERKFTGFGKEESIVRVSSRMLLRLKERIEIPER